MLRLLVLALLVLVVWALLSALLARWTGGARHRAARAGPAPAGGESLVRCRACGVLVPASRALPRPRGPEAAPYCSEACRRAAAGPG